jgi:uncharacterized membrane protein YebE (DUF533 family)
MDASFLLNTVLNGVMNSRSKRSRRAKHYLTGRAGSVLSNPATLMTAAGLAWGVFESLQAQASAGKPGPAANPLVGMPPTPDASAADAPPPVTPHTTAAPAPDAAPAVPSDAGRAAVHPAALRMIRVAISAANADGSLSERERAAIVQQAVAGDGAELVQAELRQPQPLSAIVAGVDSPDDAATLYVLAFTILRADEQVTGAERIYLAQLAHLLRLDNDTVARLERDTGERIDVLGDQGQPGG